MYKIIAFIDSSSTGVVVHDPRRRVSVSEGQLTLKLNDIDDLKLKINASNPLFGKAKPFKTHVEVWKDNKLKFRGRMISPAQEMSSEGEFTQTLTFESVTAYLLDSMQRFREVHNTSPSDFFKQLIQAHNEQVGADEQIEVRNVTVTNSTDNVYRYVDYTSTWATIKDKLISRLGGYLKSEYKDGKVYLDYLQEPGVDHVTEQAIKLGVNIKSVTNDIDPTEVITRFVPLGSTIDDNNESSTAKPRVTIASVNNGKDYIDIPELKAEFGVKTGSEVWNDVTQPENLLSKAKEWVLKQTVAVSSWQISTLELPNYDFEVGDRYYFYNRYISDPQLLRVEQKSIDIVRPHNSSLTIGKQGKRLTDYQLTALNLEKSLGELQTIAAQERRKINLLKLENEGLRQANASLQHDLLVVAGSGGSEQSGPTQPVNGDWGPVIKHAAKVMQVNISDDDVNRIKALIANESGGDQTVTQTVWDVNMANGTPAQGLLQYLPSVFRAYAVEGHTSILSGYDQLLAFFNNSNWRSDIHIPGWGPTGSKRFNKIPVITPTYNDGQAKLRAEARKYLGVKYVYGGGRPVGSANPYNGLDCSSFVAWVYHDMGVSIPAQTVAMEPSFYTVSEAQTGDVGFYGSHGGSYHVCLFLDKNTIIYAPTVGEVVKETPVSYYPPSWIGRNSSMAELINK